MIAIVEAETGDRPLIVDPGISYVGRGSYPITLLATPDPSGDIFSTYVTFHSTSRRTAAAKPVKRRAVLTNILVDGRRRIEISLVRV